MNSSKLASFLAWAQGLYFLATGVWPLVSVRTFQAVTGKKSDHLIAAAPTEADHWMLNTISGLIIAIAIVLLSAAWRGRLSFDAALLGAVSAIALAIIDVVYVARGTIAPIYLVDAAVEVVIVVTWSWLLCRSAGRRGATIE